MTGPLISGPSIATARSHFFFADPGAETPPPQTNAPPAQGRGVHLCSGRRSLPRRLPSGTKSFARDGPTDCYDRLAVAARIVLTSNGVAVGWAARIRAASPAMCGAAKLLPVATIRVPS